MTMAVTRVVLIGMTATRTVAVRGESRRKRTGIGCSAWQTERIAMRETFCLARSLSPVHIILPEVVNVMVIFVWLVPYVYAVPYRLPYGFTVPYSTYGTVATSLATPLVTVLYHPPAASALL